MCQWIMKVTVVLVMFGTLMADDLLINTPSGPIRGSTTTGYTGKQVSVFYDIPYAEPPVGDLRFGPPVYVKSWKDELNATTPSHVCYQRIFGFNGEDMPEEFVEWMPKKPWNEDCLKLHIWVPKHKHDKSTVMVYIHGGGFVAGYPLTPGLHGATLAAEENVIVVSMNYRLNVQGFMYLGIPEAPGNMGLMDQQMALNWIRRNIASFGGNPDDVTIFGMSAGGASVGFQLVSPGRGGLFRRAILISGTPNAVWSIQTKEDAFDHSMKLAKTFGCESDNPKEVLQCVKSLTPENLSDWNKGPLTLNDLQFIPTVDGTFIDDHPMTLLSKKDGNYTDIMIGNTWDEGSYFILETLPEIDKSVEGEITEEQFQSAVNRTFEKYASLATKVNPLLYIDWTRPQDPTMWRDALKDIMSDHYFACASNDFADLYSTTTRRTVYRYVVDHHFDGLPFPKWMGTPHGSDTFLHLGMVAGGGEHFSLDEVTLSRRVMRWFANFARTGNPNTRGQSGPTWDPSTLAGKEYMRIAVNPVMEKHFRTQQCTMVKKIISVVKEHQKDCHK